MNGLVNPEEATAWSRAVAPFPGEWCGYERHRSSGTAAHWNIQPVSKPVRVDGVKLEHIPAFRAGFDGRGTNLVRFLQTIGTTGRAELLALRQRSGQLLVPLDTHRGDSRCAKEIHRVAMPPSESCRSQVSRAERPSVTRIGAR